MNHAFLIQFMDVMPSYFQYVMSFFFSWDTRSNHTFMPYIMDVVTIRKRLDIPFDLICNPYTFCLHHNKPHSRHHIYWMCLYHFIGIMSWFSLRNSLNDFFISQKEFVCGKLNGKCQVWKERKGITEWVVVAFL